MWKGNSAIATMYAVLSNDIMSRRELSAEATRPVGTPTEISVHTGARGTVYVIVERGEDPGVWIEARNAADAYAMAGLIKQAIDRYSVEGSR
jgi:hypothetical protein